MTERRGWIFRRRVGGRGAAPESGRAGLGGAGEKGGLSADAEDAADADEQTDAASDVGDAPLGNAVLGDKDKVGPRFAATGGRTSPSAAPLNAYLQSLEAKVGRDDDCKMPFDSKVVEDAIVAQRRGVTAILRNDEKTGFFDQSRRKLKFYHRLAPKISASLSFAIPYPFLFACYSEGRVAGVVEVSVEIGVSILVAVCGFALLRWRFIDFHPRLDRRDIKEVRRQLQFGIVTETVNERNNYYQRARTDEPRASQFFLGCAEFLNILKWDLDFFVPLQYTLFKADVDDDFADSGRFGASLIGVVIGLLAVAYVGVEHTYLLPGDGTGEFDWFWFAFTVTPAISAAISYQLTMHLGRTLCRGRVGFLEPLVGPKLTPSQLQRYRMDEDRPGVWDWPERDVATRLVGHLEWLCRQFIVLRNHRDTPT